MLLISRQDAKKGEPCRRLPFLILELLFLFLSINKIVTSSSEIIILWFMFKHDYELHADEFLKISHDFHLGHLPTETRHPLTMNLSHMVNENLSEALRIMYKVDEHALGKMLEYSESIFGLHLSIKKTLENKKKIFLCGCGATGRLSLALETFWRELNPVHGESLISFMAGGDVALIKSVESFEDHPEYGERQLKELGFSDGDLLLAITEGGETPFVIGACNLAAKISNNKPYFLYCNPDETLKKINRSKAVIENSNIHKICFFVGPMSISGSTRMQASTVLMYGAGLALLNRFEKANDVHARIKYDLEIFSQVDYTKLAPFIQAEAEIYHQHEFVLYHAPKRLGLSILTDTTERSPTFSLSPFENNQDTGTLPSLSYLTLDEAPSVDKAWETMLYRQPRCLEWEHCFERTGLKRLMGFDISQKAKEIRDQKGKQHHFLIKEGQANLSFQLDTHHATWDITGSSYLLKQTILKMLLNTHSTLIMGKLSRYQGNIMTWVKPTNNKLIDRAARYIDFLLSDAGIEKSYEEIVKEIFATIPTMQETESIVLKTVAKLK